MPSIKRLGAPSLMLLAIALVFIRCAHPVMPTGGEKDVTPPAALRAEPPNFSTRFDAEKITIYFDEFIELKDYRKEIFISPPLEKFPEFKVKGKKLKINIEEKLRENTTYTIYFGNAVVDLTEGNPQTNFSYVFSTGDRIDSLSLTGQVVDAFNLDPVEGVLVMLYYDNNDTIPLDSLPLAVKPLSASRTVQGGTFRIDNLKGEPYKIFALEDLNANYIYDLPGERIAFLDTMVVAEYPYLTDTIVITDSVSGTDSTYYEERAVDPNHSYTLNMFQEIDSTQKLLESTEVSIERFWLIFKFPADDIDFEVVSPDTISTADLLREDSRHKDTISFWRSNVRDENDTLLMKVSSPDSVIFDTLRFIFKPRALSRRERKEGLQLPPLKFDAGIVRRTHDYFRPLPFTFSRPVKDYKSGRIMMVENETDTLGVEMEFTDSIRRRAQIDYPWKQGGDYFLLIPDSVFFDITGSSHDTVTLSFKVRNAEDYGTLILDVTDTTGSKGDRILQLMNDKREKLREHSFQGDTILVYKHLLPGSFIFKAIIDKNGNKMWDSGDYMNRRQPEPVLYHPLKFDVRANWEIRESWLLP